LEENLPKEVEGEVKTHGKNLQKAERRKTKVDKRQ
jgi:hypothetical protein